MKEVSSSYCYIDLRGTPCPLNFIRCSLAAEKLTFNQSLKVDIDLGEPEETVINGLTHAGYNVKVINKYKNYLTLTVNHLEN